MAKDIVLEEYKKTFRHLVEYTNAGGAYGLNEDGEEQAPDMGGDPSMEGGAPMADPSMGDGAPMADPSMGSGVQGFAPQGGDPSMGGEAPMSEEQPEEEEEVIDVDELVNSQEETGKKIDSLTSKFEKLIDRLGDFEKMIDSSNERIENLQKEMEKRNPTPVEKLSLRSKYSYPYAETPNEYWDKKEATSNYCTEDDENGANMPEYQITKDDIDNFTDYNGIAKTLDDAFDIRKMYGY